jgi:predicted dienelactone hydrolase
VLVGFRKGMSFDETRQNWDASGARPLAWSLWYPAQGDGQLIHSADMSWFKQHAVAYGAKPRLTDRPFRLVLLSHGSGATPSAIEWLAYGLAQQGFVVLAVHHHGHTGSEPYRAEGFLCMWERARDLSSLLSDSIWQRALGAPIDDQVDVAGFSAGAYTAMLLMGARVAYSQFEPDNPVKSPIRGPREFPDLVDELTKLQSHKVFRESWDRRRDSYADSRIARALVIAPGRSVLGFDIDSLQRIRKPILLIVGDADTVASPQECCQWLHDSVPESQSQIIGGGVGHYTFLSEGTAEGERAAPELFADGQGLKRRAVHRRVVALASEFFA